MGLFDATCALSRTAIKRGNEVLLVIVQAEKQWDTFELLQSCFRYQREKGEAKEPSPFRFLGLGKYDGYGSLNEINNDLKPENWAQSQLIVHKCVAEGLLVKHLDAAELESDVIKLIRIAFFARVQLKSNFLLGTQLADQAEIDLQRTLLNLAHQVLDRHQQRLVQHRDMMRS